MEKEEGQRVGVLRNLGFKSYLFLTIIISAICATTVLGKTLWGARKLSSMDYFPLLYPMYEFARQSWLSHGTLPLRIPNIHGGMPFLSSMVSMVLYPSELLGVLIGLDSGLFYAWDGLIHLVLAAVGGYILLTSLGFAGITSMSGGLIYAFSGLTLTNFGIGDQRELRVAAILPFLVYFIRRFLAGDRRMGIPAALMVCLMLLITAVQLAAYSFLWILLLLLLEWPRKTFRAFPWVCAIFLGGALLAAVWLVPAMEYTPHSVRSVANRELSTDQALLPVYLLECLFPGILGRTTNESVFLATQFTDNISLFTGYIPLVLLFVGLIWSWRRYGPWLAVGAFSFLLALGPDMPWGPALQSVPGFAGFRIWRRWLFLGNLSFMVFYAAGFEAYISCRAVRKWVISGMGIITLLCLLSWINRDSVIDRFKELSPIKTAIATRQEVGPALQPVVTSALKRSLSSSWSQFIVMAGLTSVSPGPTVFAAIITASSLADNLSNGTKYIGTIGAKLVKKTDQVAQWFMGRRGDYKIYSFENMYQINSRIGDGLEFFGGYHAIRLERNEYLYRMINWEKGLYGVKSAQEILSLYGVRYLVMSGNQLVNPYLMVTKMDVGNGFRLMIYEDKYATKGIFFPKLYIGRESREEILSAMSEQGWTRTDAIVRGMISEEKYLGEGSVVSYSRNAGRRQYVIDASSQVLGIIPETWCPGWRGRLDGRPVYVECVDWFLNGIFVPAGRHTLVFTYDPISFRIGLWLTFISGFTALFLFIQSFLSRKQKAENA